MLPQEVLAQIRRLQLKARRAVEDLLGGEYHSVFKGTGLAFEEVRAYQPGDDVRTIDWNVSARMGQPFIKRFVEERELTVVLAVDMSGSLRFGTQRLEKRVAAAEVAATVAFSAIANNDKVGLVAFTDRVEKLLPPRQGLRHVLRLIRDVLYFEPRHAGTNLATALDTLNKVVHRRAIVFLISDFRDEGYEKSFKRTARRHDLVAVRVSDPREEELPPVGSVSFEDAETGGRLVLDTGRVEVREAYAGLARGRRESCRRLARAAGVDLVEIGTDGRHLDALVDFFRQRERRLQRP